MEKNLPVLIIILLPSLLAEETSPLVDMELPRDYYMRQKMENNNTEYPILELELMDQGSGINANIIF